MAASGKWDPDVLQFYYQACKSTDDPNRSLPELINLDEQEALGKSGKSKKRSPDKKKSSNGSAKPPKKRRDLAPASGDGEKASDVKLDAAEVDSEASGEEKPQEDAELADAPQRQKKNGPWRKRQKSDVKEMAEVSASVKMEETKSEGKKLRSREKQLPLYLLENTEEDDLEYGDVDKMREKIFEEEQDAAIEVGLLPAHMNADERRELPLFTRQELRYIEIRNHIVKMWLERKDHYLRKEEVVQNIKAKYQLEVSTIHEYLTRAGYINVGFLPDRPQEERKESVLVLGAGFAGLMAAYQLKCFGYKVTVVEARDRVGGRTRTSMFNSGPISERIGVDMGAMVVTGTKGNPVATICKQIDQRMHVLGSSCPIFDWRTGERVPSDVDTKVEKQFNTILDIAAKMPPRVQTSLGKAVEQLICEANPGPLERSLFDWHVANLEYGCATELTPVSLQHWDQDDAYELGGDHCLLPSGYSSIAKAVAAQLDIKLNTPVKEVAYSSTGVQLTTNDGQTLSADFCICTLPLGVLKANTVQFNPSLPPFKRAVIQRLGFGVLNKISLHFAEAFWPNTEDYFGITAEKTESRGENFLFWNIYRCTGAPVLLALIAGRSALPIESESDDAIAERSLAALKRVFKDRVTKLLRCEVTRWKSDPYSCGSYTFVAEGATGVDYDELAQPVDRLFFAGEATCREHPATVVGAALSGLREAGRVEKMVRGPLQTAPLAESVADSTVKSEHNNGVNGDDEYQDSSSRKRRSTTTSIDELPSFRKGSIGGMKESRPSFLPAPTVAPPPVAKAKSLFSFNTGQEQPPPQPLPQVTLPPPMLRPLAPIVRAPYTNKPPAAVNTYPPSRPAASPQIQQPSRPLVFATPPAFPPESAHGFSPPQPTYAPRSGSTPTPPVSRPASAASALGSTSSSSLKSSSDSERHKDTKRSSDSADLDIHRKLRDEVSEVVKQRLDSWNKKGRIATREDFKDLARKMTHKITETEIQRNAKEIDGSKRQRINDYVDKFFNVVYAGVYNKKSAGGGGGSSESSH